MSTLPPDGELAGIIRHQILKPHPPKIGAYNVTNRGSEDYYHEADHDINQRYTYRGRIDDTNLNADADPDEVAKYLKPHRIDSDGEVFTSRFTTLTLSSGLFLETEPNTDTTCDGVLQFDLNENNRTTTYTKHFTRTRQAKKFGKKLGKAMETGEKATREFLEKNANNQGTWPPIEFK